MKRKDFIKKATLGTISVASLATACRPESATAEGDTPSIQTGKKYRWNMLTTWPPNYPIIGEGCEMFAQWVKDMSGGRLTIKVYGGGELVPALEAFDAVTSGTAEMAHGSAYYWAGKAPAAQFFASIPFGMNAQQMNSWLLSGGGLELWRELYAKFNLIPFPAGNTGVQMGGWFNKEINSLADLKGLKMRIPGFGGKVLEKAGGTPVLSAGSEIYTNLERGVIDATEWIGPFHDYKMGFEALPKDLQVIVESAALRLNMWMLSEIEAQNNVFMDKLLTEGVEVRTFPDEVLAELRSYTDEILGEITAADPFAKRVYDSQMAFKKRAAKWGAVTEKVFYDKIM